MENVLIIHLKHSTVQFCGMFYAGGTGTGGQRKFAERGREPDAYYQSRAQLLTFVAFCSLLEKGQLDSRLLCESRNNARCDSEQRFPLQFLIFFQKNTGPEACWVMIQTSKIV